MIRIRMEMSIQTSIQTGIIMLFKLSIRVRPSIVTRKDTTSHNLSMRMPQTNRHHKIHLGLRVSQRKYS